MDIKITHAISIDVQVSVNGNATIATLNLNGLNLGNDILKVINKNVKTLNIVELKNLGLFDNRNI
tara:strand:+ start:3240 stop:3434 length:195 start_codon:yes stop_codon:yes gene_type:complete